MNAEHIAAVAFGAVAFLTPIVTLTLFGLTRKARS